MRYLILSDLHANWEALDAVAQEAAGQYDKAICCGDLIGYAADPNLVVQWVRDHCSAVVRGNHDRACTGMDDLEWFNPVARQAALWTQRTLTPELRDYALALAKGPVMIEDFELAHGSPFDEDEYLLSAPEAGQAFEYLERRLAFFGHTHVQGGFIWNQGRVETIGRMGSKSTCETLEIDPACAYMINPGSVGQPRDGDPRAAWVQYDSDQHLVSYHRTAYDIETAQRKIREAGLPPILADRLMVGR